MDRLRTQRAWQQLIKIFEQRGTKSYVRGIFQGWDEDGRAIFTRTHAGVQVVRICPENSSFCVNMKVCCGTNWKLVDLDIPPRIDARDLFNILCSNVGCCREHKVTVLHGNDTFDIYEYDGVVHIPKDSVLFPERKLDIWLFEGVDAHCQRFHLWESEMQDFLSHTGVFVHGHAYGLHGNIIDEEHCWSVGSHHIFTLPSNERWSQQELEWQGPTICTCDPYNAPFECPSIN